MSYKNQHSNLVYKLQAIEKEKLRVDDKLERFSENEKHSNDSNNNLKRNRTYGQQQPNRNNNNHNNHNNNNNQYNDERARKRQQLDTKSIVEGGTTVVNKKPINNDPELQKRGRMFVGLLNKTLQDFQKDITRKTTSDKKREQVELKVESIINQEENDRLEKEKLKKQQQLEREQRVHDDLLKKQQQLEDRILEETWNLHHSILSSSNNYKTVNSKTNIYFQLSPLAEKHGFKLSNCNQHHNKYQSYPSTTRRSSSPLHLSRSSKFEKREEQHEGMHDDKRRRKNDSDSESEIDDKDNNSNNNNNNNDKQLKDEEDGAIFEKVEKITDKIVDEDDTQTTANVETRTTANDDIQDTTFPQIDENYNNNDK